LPTGPPEAIQHRARFGAAVTRQHLDVFNRNEEPCVVGIGQRDAIVRCARYVQRLQPLVPADTMIDMNHKIARFQARDLADEGLGLARRPARAACQRISQDVLLGQNRDIVGDKAVFERQDRQGNRRAGQP
jgi:hypothetical protein